MRIHRWLRRLLGRGGGLAKGAPYVVRHSYGTAFFNARGGADARRRPALLKWLHRIQRNAHKERQLKAIVGRGESLRWAWRPSAGTPGASSFITPRRGRAPPKRR